MTGYRASMNDELMFSSSSDFTWSFSRLQFLLLVTVQGLQITESDPEDPLNPLRYESELQGALKRYTLSFASRK